MRVLLAGLFVFGGMILAVAILSPLLPTGFPPLLLGLGMAMLMLLLCVLALVLFNRPGAHPLGNGAGDAFLRDLEERGLLVSTDYRATRAFQVDEVEDEGPHYFVELEDGRVLYLNGQYLFEYEETDDDLELTQPRRFPCTEFTVRRHWDAGYVIDLLCGGRVLEPEVVAPPFSDRDYREGRIPDDGEIIISRTYEEIKAERMTR